MTNRLLRAHNKKKITTFIVRKSIPKGMTVSKVWVEGSCCLEIQTCEPLSNTIEHVLAHFIGAGTEH